MHNGLFRVGVMAAMAFVWSGAALAQVPPPSEEPGGDAVPSELEPGGAVPQTDEVEDGEPQDVAAPTPQKDTESVQPEPPLHAAVALPLPSEVAAEDWDGPDEKDLPKLDVGMRLMGGYRYRDQAGRDATYGFALRQIRLKVRLKWKKRWYTRASVDFRDGITPGVGTQYLRTAVLEYRYSKSLRFAVGRYKRPFSYLELQSVADLPMLNRGLLNDLIVEDSGWGDRGIGAMASGKYKPAKLAWNLSLTNPSPDNLATQGLDVIGRVAWSPVDEFQLGVHGGNKYLDFDQGRTHFQAVGGDIRLRFGGLEWQIEGMIADAPWRKSVAYGGTTLVSYVQPITKHLKLMPFVFGEYADANSEYQGNESVRFQGGVNLVIRDRFRIMPQVRMTKAVGEPLRSAPTSSPEFQAINPWTDGTQLYLYFSLAL